MKFSLWPQKIAGTTVAPTNEPPGLMVISFGVKYDRVIQRESARLRGCR